MYMRLYDHSMKQLLRPPPYDYVLWVLGDLDGWMPLTDTEVYKDPWL